MTEHQHHIEIFTENSQKKRHYFSQWWFFGENALLMICDLAAIPVSLLVNVNQLMTLHQLDAFTNRR